MANTKKRKYSLLGWIGGHKLISFILILIIAIAGYFAYRAIALRQNKHDFQKASATINEIYNDIVRQIGKPDNAKVASFCARAHQEFTQGELSCDVGLSIVFSVDNEPEANNIYKGVQNITSDVKDFKVTQQSSSIRNSVVLGSSYHTATDKYRITHLNCTVNYIYDTPKETDLKINDLSKKSFEITIGCYGPARQQYYRLAQ